MKLVINILFIFLFISCSTEVTDELQSIEEQIPTTTEKILSESIQLTDESSSVATTVPTTSTTTTTTTTTVPNTTTTTTTTVPPTSTTTATTTTTTTTVPPTSTTTVPPTTTTTTVPPTSTTTVPPTSTTTVPPTTTTTTTTTIPQPPQVTELSSSNITTSSITLNWSVQGNYEYITSNVFIWTGADWDNQGTFSSGESNSSSHSKEFTNLDADTSFQFQVCAYDGNTAGNNCSQITESTACYLPGMYSRPGMGMEPYQPSRVNDADGNFSHYAQIRFAFSTSSYNTDGFRVYLDGSLYFDGMSANGWLDDGIWGPGTYFWELTAYNDCGETEVLNTRTWLINSDGGGDF